MRKMMLVCMVALMLAGCGASGHLPIAVEGNTTKYFVEHIGGGLVQNMGRPIAMVAFVDSSRHNPLNALDYMLEDSETLFFDYVVLGGAYVRRNDRGFYLHLSEDLRNLLAMRRTLVHPLQKAGIKVLLRVESGGGEVSFGNWNEDQMHAFTRSVYDVLQIFGLNGAEFYDNSDEGAHPGIHDFDADSPDAQFLSPEEWLVLQWANGGNEFNNVFHTLRHFFPAGRDRDEVVTFLREKNFGRWFPHAVGSTDGWADFAVSDHQITFSFTTNPRLVYELGHGEEALSAQRIPPYDVSHLDEDSIGHSWMSPGQFGPLMIDLNGGSGRNVFFPLVENARDFDPLTDNPGPSFSDIRGFTRNFHRAIYFDNLMAISEAAENDFFRWLYFDPDLPTTAGFEVDGDGIFNPAYIPLPVIFDELSRVLFREGVIDREGGGNHVKIW